MLPAVFSVAPADLPAVDKETVLPSADYSGKISNQIEQEEQLEQQDPASP